MKSAVSSKVSDALSAAVSGALSAARVLTLVLLTLPGLSFAQSGLVAAYGFNEGSGTTVADASGRGNTGTISGATWSTQGRFGKALSFDGVNDQVSIASATSLNLPAAMTLSAWVFPTATQSNWRAILVKGDEPYALYSSNETAAMKPAGVWEFTGDVEESVKSPTAIAVNVWTHLAVTYDGAMLRLFINGAQVASKPRTGNVANSSQPLRIGGNGASGEFFKGRIDEVRVYNRALSQAEIQADMNTAVVAGAPVGVSVQNPLNGAVVASDNVTVSGTFVGPSNTGITVNGIVAAIVGNTFVAANVPLQAGANTLTVTLNTLGNQTATQTLSVTSTGPAAIEVVASPTQGAAPLSVTFTINNRTGNAIQSVQADYAGGGGFISADPKLLSNSYIAAEIYQATFIITVSTGASYQRSVTIAVQDTAQFDQMLRTAWQGFTTVLAARDTTQALQHFNAQGRAKYGPVFSALLPDLSQIVASFSAPELLSITGEVGEYAVTRMIGGVAQIFLIYFIRDTDGVWRLDEM